MPRLRATDDQLAELRNAVEVEGESLHSAWGKLAAPKPGYTTFARLLPDLVKRGVDEHAKRRLVNLDEAENLLVKASQKIDAAEIETTISATDMAQRAIAEAYRWIDDARCAIRTDERVPEKISFERDGNRTIRKVYAKPSLTHPWRQRAA